MKELILSQSGFILFISFFIAGAFISLVLSKKEKMANFFGNIFALAGSFYGLVFSVLAFQGEKLTYKIPSLLFSSFSATFAVDKLSAFFIFIVSLISFFCSIYAFGYVKHFYGKYNIGFLGFLYNIFVLGIIGVFSASNFIFFLTVWELMTLASYFLVIYEYKEESNIKAGFVYFIMTHIGTALIFLAIFLMHRFSGSFDFDVIHSNFGNIPDLAANIIFICAFLGFGVKSGIIPLHTWLPKAHPAAPSHISALMSGVMIKTGAYMMIRIFFDIFSDVPTWYGVIVISIGAVSALLGILYAVAEYDLKRLLAFSSIENMGIVLLGIGGSLLALSLHMPSLALLGFIAALFHILNHSIFKSLLFLSAGSVVMATHTKNMEKYGGLIKKMPYTAVFFIIGSMAVAALPPFNGFFSEWIIFQSLFGGVSGAGSIFSWVFLLAAGALAASGGLALACFVKACGTTFLARPRSDILKGDSVKEGSFSILTSMAGLSVAILFLGIFSGSVLAKLKEIASDFSFFTDADTALLIGYKTQTVVANGGFASISPMLIFSFIVFSILTVFLITRYLVRRDQKVIIGRTWDCGTNLTPRLEMTSTGFARSLVLIFKKILKPTRQTEVEYRDADMRYLPKSRIISLRFDDVYQLYFYNPIVSVFSKIAEKARMTQSGNLNVYILYLFLALLTLLFLI